MTDLELTGEVAQETVARARVLTGQPALPQGTVLSYDNAAGVAIVVPDGVDTAGVAMPVVCDTPITPGSRVKYLVTPPHGAVVIGVIGGSPQWAKHSTAGDAVNIATATIVRATVTGPTFAGLAVDVTYHGWCTINYSASEIVVLTAEVSLDNGATWLNARASNDSGSTTPNQWSTVPFGSWAAGSATTVLARLASASVVGARATLANFMHHLIVLPKE